MAQMNIKEEEAKREGLWLAESAKRESLERARAHLLQLALQRLNGEVTADDADDFIKQNGLKPLGNAAGALFSNKKVWEFTGDWRPSEKEGNHRHQNRVWRVRVAWVRAHEEAWNDDPKPEPKKKLTPSQAKKELKALAELYEESSGVDMTEEMYDALKSDIYERMQ